MAIAILDVRADRVQVGSLFDTEKRYIYRNEDSTLSSDLVKMPVGRTIEHSSDNFTFRFDGAVYYVNSSTTFTPTVLVFGIT